MVTYQQELIFVLNNHLPLKPYHVHRKYQSLVEIKISNVCLFVCALIIDNHFVYPDLENFFYR